MKKYALRIVIALVTFLIGVGLYSALFSRQRAVQTVALVPTSTDCHGFVTVESQPQAPVRLIISTAACTHVSVIVRFTVENISDKPIVKYEVRGIRSNDSSGNNLSVTSEWAKPVDPHERRSGLIQEGLFEERIISAGQKTSFQLAVYSVTFADGTTWRR